MSSLTATSLPTSTKMKKSTGSKISVLQIQNTIVQDIKTNIPYFSTLSQDIGLIEFITQSVHSVCHKDKVTTDEKALVIAVMTELFSLNPTQQSQTGSIVDYMIEAGQIKKPSNKILSKVIKGVFSFLKKV